MLRGDRRAFNGYVHVLDEVLQPPSETIAHILALDPTLSRFTSLITRVSCLDELVFFFLLVLCQVVAENWPYYHRSLVEVVSWMDLKYS